MSSNNLRHAICFACTGLSLLPNLSFANNDGITIEEVLVTAQKREQSLQDTPMAITALGETDMERKNVTDFNSFANFVPNLHIVSAQGDTTTALVAMRGTVNSNPTNLGNEGTVGVYFDGVFIAKGNGAIFEFADVERIEVLRGPQGTLYGKNTIGGAINIISSKPTGEFGGSLKFGVGTDNLFHSKGNFDLPSLGIVNIGLGELRAKVSLVTKSKDGATDNVQQSRSFTSNPISSEDRFGDIDQVNSRVALSWLISDAFTVDYSYDNSRVRGTARPFQVLEIVEGGLHDPNGGAASSLSYLELANYLEPGRVGESAADYDLKADADVEGHAINIDWSLGDMSFLGDVSIKSITASREIEQRQKADLDGSDLSLLHFDRNLDYEQFSQEFQIIGDSGPVQYVAGLYYFEEEGLYDSPRTVFGEFGFPEYKTQADMENDLKAVYGQVDWSPDSIEGLNISFGARYSEETKDMYRYAEKRGGGIDIAPTNLPTLDFSETTVMFSPSYQITEEANIYFRYSEGYRSGGYDGQSAANPGFSVPYDSELLTAYELGLKSQWLDRRLQVNAAVFLSDYEDIQIGSYDSVTFSTFTDNAAQAQITGLELEVLALISESLTVSLNYGYLDAEYDEFNAATASSGGVQDLADVAAFPYTPENTVNVGIDYSPKLFSFGEFNIHLDYSYVDDHQVGAHNAGNTPRGSIENYSLVNARISLSEIAVSDQTIEVALWGKNIFDEEYLTTTIDFQDFVAGEVGDGESYGVEASIRF